MKIIWPFCPVNINETQRPYALNTEELFKKIISELEKCDYSGQFALFSNNEPFIDNRIVEFHKYAREHLKKAYIHICTNGTLLTLDKFLSILPYIDNMVIDNYNDLLELHENLVPIYKHCTEHPELFRKVIFVMRWQNEKKYPEVAYPQINDKQKQLIVDAPYHFDN